jgi:hypothetical protein
LTPLSRLAALALGGALALTGCSGSDEPVTDVSSSTSADTGSSGGASDGSPGTGLGTRQPTPTTDVRVPDGVTLTDPGARLGFGDTGRVAYEVTRPGKKGRKVTTGTVLALTVDSARKGSLADLSGFNLTDPYQRKANYYYVDVTVKNLGAKRFGDVDVPLFGISGENTLLPPVRFTSAFAKCPTQRLPLGFAPGKRFRTCLVFLSPDKGALAGVSFRPTPSSTPVEWHGKVRVPGGKGKGGKGGKGGSGKARKGTGG